MNAIEPARDPPDPCTARRSTRKGAGGREPRAADLDVYVAVMDVGSRLQELGVPESVYSVGRERNETYCLVEEADGWHVFYSERGNRNNEFVFVSEAAASDELVRLVTTDGAIQPMTQIDTGACH